MRIYKFWLHMIFTVVDINLDFERKENWLR